MHLSNLGFLYGWILFYEYAYVSFGVVMKKIFFILAVACVLVIQPLQQAQAESFKAGSDIWYPFFYMNSGQPDGIAVKVISEVMKRSHHTIEFKHIPNRRMRLLLEHGDIDTGLLDAPLWQTEKERAESIFSSPILTIPEYVYVLKSNSFYVERQEDLLGKKVAINAGYLYPSFEYYFKTKKIIKIENPKAENLPAMVGIHRADAFFMDTYLFGYLSRQGLVRARDFQPVYKISQAQVAFKFHKSFAPYLNEFNQILEDLKNEGFLESVVQDYTRQAALIP